MYFLDTFLWFIFKLFSFFARHKSFKFLGRNLQTSLIVAVMVHRRIHRNFVMPHPWTERLNILSQLYTLTKVLRSPIPWYHPHWWKIRHYLGPSSPLNFFQSWWMCTNICWELTCSLHRESKTLICLIL